MKHAFLIRAFNQPRLVPRLIDRLADPDAHFFIHIDRKVDIRPFQEALETVRNPNIHWAPKRFRVEWMGFSQVETALALIDQASSFMAFDRYSLLSSADYPIKPKARIASLLATTDAEFISHWRIEDRPSWRHKILYYYPIDVVPIWHFEERFFPNLFWKTFFRLRHHLPQRKPLPDVIPYGGTSWWTLTHSCARYVLDFARNHPGFCAWYRHTHAPDEMFFQTIVMNSHFAPRAALLAEYNQWQRETPPAEKAREVVSPPADGGDMRHVDWTQGREKPSILDDRDFDSIRASPRLFARKFDFVRSAALLDRIDREILNVPSWKDPASGPDRPAEGAP